MWYMPETEEQRKAREERDHTQFKEAMEAARKKDEALAAWRKDHTCEVCGRSDPPPPWLWR